MGVHRMRVYPLIKVCFYTNFKVWKLVPVFPPFSEIIRCNARWTVRAASSTLHLSALLRTSRSLCKCCHKNCPTDCDEHEGVISCAVAFEEKNRRFLIVLNSEIDEKRTWLLFLIKTIWILILSGFRQSYLQVETGLVIWWSRVQTLETLTWFILGCPEFSTSWLGFYTHCK